ncbi:hypothetical protein RHSIM_Rhsim11G0073200 [Rhododendron simsii]|uniref:Uncharacterized protein n=1 Tax=Rhododendron simsii TaxID=118357 RepID=A0A834LB03_RHOSS|nr:hypothetical protein RHSIM_Rhsim11G0073200 [Rhododendron simsii]
MGAKPREKVGGAKGGGGGGTEAADPTAEAVRTKPAFASLVPPKRKLVKKMMGDAMVQAFVSVAAAAVAFSTSITKKNNKKKIFPA